MAEFQKNCTVCRVERRGADIVRLDLEAPEIAGAAAPGRFVMAACGANRDPLLRRPISVHDCPGDGRLALLIRVVGRGTALLAGLREGDSLSLIGPLGHGFGPAPADGDVALVGGGIGAAPLLFLARHLLAQGRTPTILLGAACAVEARIFQRDFLALGCPVQVSTDDGSLGHHGFVTDLLPALQESAPLSNLHPPHSSKIYTCGPLPMMAGVARFCAERGIVCEVSLETGMACGLGACLGCAAPAPGGGYRHVCKDGPVFNASEVAWP